MAINFIRKALRSIGVALMLVSSASYASAQTDPPGRVARLNYFEGSVSFSPAGSEDWAYAQLNRPLIGGDRLWVADASRSELHIGSTALRLNRLTSLRFLNLADNALQVQVVQGTLDLRVRSLAESETLEIDTPNIAFVIQKPGSYRINVDPDRGISSVTVWQGRGAAYGNNTFLILDGRQQVRFAGTDLSQVGGTDAPGYDSFDAWALNRDRAEDAAISARYVSREMIGYEQLDAYGSWQQTSQYGAVWVPRVVVAGWAPYRTGHWAWISPWGWTWIDDAPWGFAPYHYGRWAYVGNAWCWVPGALAIHARPVYAPALVAFFGNRHDGASAGFSISVNGVPASGVAWMPLGPGEFYRPAYAASPRYTTNINKTVIVNNTSVNQTIVNNITRNVYVNQAAPNAVTAVPLATFARGQPVAPAARIINPRQLQAAQVIGHAAPVAPLRESMTGTRRPVAAPPVVASMPRNAPVIPASPMALRDKDARENAASKGITHPSVSSAVPVIKAPVRTEQEAARRANVAQPFAPPAGNAPRAMPAPHQPDNASLPVAAARHADAVRIPREAGDQAAHAQNAVPRIAAPVLSAPPHDKSPHAMLRPEGSHASHASRSEDAVRAEKPTPRPDHHEDHEHRHGDGRNPEHF